MVQVREGKHIGASMAAIALLLAPAMAVADDKVDCADPQVQMEMNYCAEQDYKAADAALNTAYKKAMAAMKETDSYLSDDMKGAADALLAAQRAWIPYRDKACASAGYVVRGGSMEPMIIYQCMARITRERTAELNDLAQGMGN